jgi:hypothetical protein
VAEEFLDRFDGERSASGPAELPQDSPMEAG